MFKNGEIPKNRKHIIIPEKNEYLAEFIGIMLGDGNIYVKENKSLYQIRIAFNYYIEKEYAFFISDLIKKLFGLESSINFKKGQVCVNSKELAEFLIKENIPSGKRTKLTIHISEWINSKNKFMFSFIRGLVDTDGSIFRLSQKDKNILRISFKNSNISLSNIYRNLLISFDFHPSKITYQNIFLTRKADTARYLKEIGFHNPKNNLRLLNIARSSSGQSN